MANCINAHVNVNIAMGVCHHDFPKSGYWEIVT